jgi:hypothetical protein
MLWNYPSREVCNDQDDDGNGLIDEGCDDDRDGYCDAGLQIVGSPAGCPHGGGDCDDTSENDRPGGIEFCDGEDNSCDGQVDEGFGISSAEVSLAPAVLWPPNGRIVDIQSSFSFTKNCPTASTTPRVALAGVSSNEADDADGPEDGNTTGDIQVGATGTTGVDLSLRAERAGRGTGRVYTVTYQVTDDADRITNIAAEVVVPHDQGGGGTSTTVQVKGDKSGTVLEWMAVPDALAYSVERGNLSALRLLSDSTLELGPLVCLESRTQGLTTRNHGDDEDPPVGEGFFYLVGLDLGWGLVYETEIGSNPRSAYSGGCE